MSELGATKQELEKIAADNGRPSPDGDNAKVSQATMVVELAMAAGVGLLCPANHEVS